MNIIEKLKYTVEKLANADVSEPHLITEIVLAHCLDIKRLELPSLSSQSVDDEMEIRIDTIIDRLIQGEPLQYVLGTTDFMGRLLFVDPRVLIPRPETEELVDFVSRYIQQLPVSPLPQTGIDVGTGSGCIAITLACLFPSWKWQATDLSTSALEVAQKNAITHNVDNYISFNKNDLLDDYDANSFDLVVANLPYIPSDECKQLSPIVQNNEPLSALDGGSNGLSLIHRLIVQAEKCLRPAGRIFLEIGYNQGQNVRSLLEESGFGEICLHQDMAGHDRIVTGTKGCK